MSKQTEDKKLNRLNFNKETVSDLDVPQAQEIVGGGKQSDSPANCIPSPSALPGDRACYTKGPANCPGPIVAPKPSVYC